jgi:3-methyladenine DNA glycosylase/8-oxoguanine DNA glycosylase
MSVHSLASHAREVPVVGEVVTDGDLAYRYLAETDPVLRFLVSVFGHPDPFGRCEEAGLGDHFAALVRYVTGRPTDTSSSSILYARIRRATRGFPSAAKIAALGPHRLAGLGLPGPEADRLVRLARDVLDGRLSLNTLAGKNDQQVRSALTGYGFGRWPVDMFLIRRLHRPDVLPADDLALTGLIGRYWMRAEAPGATQLDRVGESWAPFRTYAAALLWSLSRTIARPARQESSLR